jgi:hypothetical protein
VSETSERRLVVGFVVEGSTDFVVLRRVVESVFGDIEDQCLQPQTDELDRTKPGAKSGWSEVKAWCHRLEDLDELFDPMVGEPLDLLVIAIDLDIAIRAGLEKCPENLDGYDARRLCNIVKSWLPRPLSERVIIAIPVMSLEAWILAALYPKRSRFEADLAPAEALVRAGKIERGRNGPWKRAVEYRPFAELVAKRLKRVRTACGEANRFVAKLERTKSLVGLERR